MRYLSLLTLIFCGLFSTIDLSYEVLVSTSKSTLWYYTSQGLGIVLLALLMLNKNLVIYR